LKNCNQKNLFEIIISLFSELFKKYVLCFCDDNFNENQKKKITKLFVLIAISCFNFYYGEDCPLNFNIIYKIIDEVKKNNHGDEDRKLFDKFEKSINSVKNCRELKESCCEENIISMSNYSNSSSLFSYNILERIIKNSESENMMEMSFCADIEIVECIELLVNSLSIQSIFFPPKRSSYISICSFNHFILERKSLDFRFYDKMFIYFIL
jgi:hypothetical protein